MELYFGGTGWAQVLDTNRVRRPGLFLIVLVICFTPPIKSNLLQEYTGIVSVHFQVPSCSHWKYLYLVKYDWILNAQDDCTWSSPKVFFSVNYKVRNTRNDFTYSGQKTENLLSFSLSFKLHKYPYSLRQRKHWVWILRMVCQSSSSLASQICEHRWLYNNLPLYYFLHV